MMDSSSQHLYAENQTLPISLYAEVVRKILSCGQTAAIFKAVEYGFGQEMLALSPT